MSALEGTGRVAGEITNEGIRAAELHGEPAERTGLQWLAILAEDFGEVAAEVARGEVPPIYSRFGDPTGERYRERLRNELIQVASVAMRWVVAIDRGEGIER
jgi:hypothetical protein